MNKDELARALAKEANITIKDADFVIASFVNVITRALSDGKKVRVNKLGTFEMREYAGKNGRNPNNGEKIYIPAYNTIKFKASTVIKEKVNALA